jgi:TolB protein
MQTTYRFGAVPRTAVILAILAALLIVLSAIALGQQPSPKLPPPVGVARNGLLAFDDVGVIYVVEPYGTGRKALTDGPEWEVEPVWSPDGTRIAYWSQKTPDGISALDVMDADGTNVRTLVDGITLSRWSTHPAWSHDGRSLAYSDHSFASGREVDRVMVVSLSGGEPRELVIPGEDPTWSPDDQLIGYRSGGWAADGTFEPPGLGVIGADGNDPKVIDPTFTTNAFAYAHPAWSPDGRWLAYHTGVGDNMDIYVAAVDGSRITAVADQPTGEVWPVWSPDGTRLAYDGPSTTQGQFQVVTVDPDGSNPTTLQHPPLGCNCGVVWSPDGTLVTAYADGPVGHEDTGGSMLIIDPSGKAPVTSIPYTGLSDQAVSWQRLAP